MGLMIQQTFGKLQMERSRGFLSMNTEEGKLVIRQYYGKMEIHTEQAKVYIDQRECFSAVGLKSYSELIRDNAEYAYNQCMEYIAKTAQQGDRLASIQTGENAIVNIAMENSNPEEKKEIIIASVPRPKFDVTGGITMRKAENPPGAEDGVIFSYTPGKVSFNYKPSTLRFYVDPYPSIKFSYVPDKVDLKL